MLLHCQIRSNSNIQPRQCANTFSSKSNSFRTLLNFAQDASVSPSQRIQSLLTRHNHKKEKPWVRARTLSHPNTYFDSDSVIPDHSSDCPPVSSSSSSSPHLNVSLFASDSGFTVSLNCCNWFTRCRHASRLSLALSI